MTLSRESLCVPTKPFRCWQYEIGTWTPTTPPAQYFVRGTVGHAGIVEYSRAAYRVTRETYKVVRK
jgi:hypothetical protein